ncbi:hypothetical protein MUO14_16275 [Halobacillus shinanisalinarum]|uniref:SR1 protein n=1 Tax=Halobacillus shinanisalinarum TaxID=2932258 RepID=A0ABY4GWF0_9BACI|nr:hypothetical protein [Halobacillus shinanisalinarum]UOQ92045.1 hypothetical protein MUO14_16275 [Halobacillus shinanisalinarum]
MEANKKWLSLPKDIRSQLIGNVFCSNCLDAVTITDFIIVDHPSGVLLKGKCKNCGNEVARVVEAEE